MSASPAPVRRRRRSARRLGFLLLAAALVCFLLTGLEPVIPGIMGVLLLGTGWGLVAGGLDPAPRMKALINRDPAAISRRPPVRPDGVREFSYPRAGCFSAATVYACGALQAAVGLLLTGVTIAGQLNGAAGLVFGPIFTAGGVLLMWWFSQIKHALVTTGPDSIAVRTPFTRRTIRWDEVTALEWSVIQNAAGAVLTGLIRIHCRETFVRIENRIAGFDELRDLVSAATGLDWT